MYDRAGDGTMTLDIAEGITESVTVSGFAEAAPWDNFKKYVENIKIESEKIVLGSEAICGFANLRKVTFAPDSTYDENAFVDCEYLSPEDIVVIACNHEYGEWNRTKEPTCTRTGEEKRVCIKCGQTETKEVDPLGHIWGEWYVEREATETETGLMIRFCQREGDTDYRETQVIPKLEHVHDMVEHPAAEPTCTADGNTAYWECSKCGKYYADADAT